MIAFVVRIMSEGSFIVSWVKPNDPLMQQIQTNTTLLPQSIYFQKNAAGVSIDIRVLWYDNVYPEADVIVFVFEYLTSLILSYGGYDRTT